MIETISVHVLLTQLRHGQERALDVLYPRYARIFYVYARRRGFAHEDAEDIVQGTFWRMLDSIASYDEEAGGGERWLWSICKNQVIDALRRKKISSELPEDEKELLAEDSDPAGYFEKRERVESFLRAWGELAEADRQELRRGRGRGPGRKAWHGAVARLRMLCVRDE